MSKARELWLVRWFPPLPGEGQGGGMDRVGVEIEAVQGGFSHNYSVVYQGITVFRLSQC